MPRNNLFLTLIFSLCYAFAIAQYPANPVTESSVYERLDAIEVRNELIQTSNYSGVEAQNIGPTIMSGRVVDMAIDPANPIHFFVAYATGGVWETKNNGQSFSPIFDTNGYTNNCGAIAVNWSTKVIYVGTGEANSSRSSYPGYGVFACRFNAGKNDWKGWKNIGLQATHHISKIVVHPRDTNMLWVAAMGNLFSANEERGVYKTTDGGENWKQVLYVDENTSAVDLELHQSNPNVLAAAMWQKTRRAWNFWESGEHSGVFISSDGGDTWTKSEAFPNGEHIGRIGLSSSGNRLYALLDNQQRYTEEKEARDGIQKRDFEQISADSFLLLNDSALNAFLDRHQLAKEYSSKKLKKMVRKEELHPKDLFDYFYDNNAAMFEDPITGAELYRSDDFGVSWVKTHSDILKNVCYTYGYYFGVVAANPVDSSHVFIAGVPLLQSFDEGQNFSFAGGDNVHVDHHFIWINPNNPQHLINGNDGGINISYDGGRTWVKCNSPAVGQFYTVAVDYKKDYNVYGGLQDNGTWRGPHKYNYSTAWHQEGKYAYTRIGGGDGMQVQIDPRDNSVYTGYQYGHYNYKSVAGKNQYIHPKHDLKEPHLRWNWQSPILLSPHDADVLYVGSNKLYRSKKKAKDFRPISPDLTNGVKEGDVSYGTLTCIAESTLKEGLLYTGSDDGLIHHSPDGGKTWHTISDSLPQHLWVKEVVASRHTESRVLVALNGYTWDHFKSYLYLSDNNGKSWVQIGANLPNEPINTVIEDPSNAQILYLGTDGGLYISSDYGKSFQYFSNLPMVPIHGLTIQENHRDLIVATHGRSLFKVQLEPVYQYETFRDSSFSLLPVAYLKFNKNWGQLNYIWDTKIPSLDVQLFTKSVQSIKIEIQDADCNILLSETREPYAGYNKMSVELQFDENPTEKLLKGSNGKYYPIADNYTVRVTQDGVIREQTFIVK